MSKQVTLGAAVLLCVLAMSSILDVGATPLELEGVQTWYWTSDTGISSVAVGDVDGDDSVEIVTGGDYLNDTAGVRVAQLCVWNSSTLTVENVKAWYWTSDTQISSLAIGDVDDDGSVEIVTGGTYHDGVRSVAQLCVWDGSTLELENVMTWYWTSATFITSLVVDDVDDDESVEVVTTGYYSDGVRWNAQLCVWSGATLALENVMTWYWTHHTYTYSVAVGDVDGDDSTEIVTGGYYEDVRDIAQLCVWDGSSLALENVTVWYWYSDTGIYSVCVDDVDGDASVEIVTGGHHWDGFRTNAQLCIWDGATLTLEHVTTWFYTPYMFGHAIILSLAVGDVDADESVEIVTGGRCADDLQNWYAQLVVWDGSTLMLEDVTSWYWTANTFINSVATGDVDGDSAVEIVTGGHHWDGTRSYAQLTVWV